MYLSPSLEHGEGLHGGHRLPIDRGFLLPPPPHLLQGRHQQLLHPLQVPQVTRDPTPQPLAAHLAGHGRHVGGGVRGEGRAKSCSNLHPN